MIILQRFLKPMRPVWENRPGYNLARRYAGLCTAMSYFRLDVVGRELIPDDGAVILAPNHCNTLMDALVVAKAGRRPTLFAVRADIFRKPETAGILRWLKMVPLSRVRDGLQEVARNYEVFEEIVDTLAHDIPFCIFFEGTHRAKRSLLPIKKGIFRIACKASRKLEKPVYIVPVGLEYDDYFKYMRPVRLSYGAPFNVTEYVNAHQDATEAEIYAAMSSSLHESVSSMITYFPDDENYYTAVAEWEKKRRPAKHWWEWVLAPVLLPVFILSGLLCLPMWVVSAVLISRAEDKAWCNTIRFGCKAAMLPLLLIAFGIPAFIFLPWYAAVLALVAVTVSHSLFYHILNMYTKLLRK